MLMARRTLDQKLLPLATRFAQQIARLVEQDTRKAVAAEVKQRLRGFRSGGGGTPRAAKRIVVECPYPGCKNQGVRTLSNFCVEHNRTLSASEKKKLREAQRQARTKAAKA
jgi:hypothetical protein